MELTFYLGDKGNILISKYIIRKRLHSAKSYVENYNMIYDMTEGIWSDSDMIEDYEE